MTRIEVSFDVGDRCRVKRGVTTYLSGTVSSLIFSRVLGRGEAEQIEVYDVRLDDGGYLRSLKPSEIIAGDGYGNA